MSDEMKDLEAAFRQMCGDELLQEWRSDVPMRSAFAAEEFKRRGLDPKAEFTRVSQADQLSQSPTAQAPSASTSEPTLEEVKQQISRIKDPDSNLSIIGYIAALPDVFFAGESILYEMSTHYNHQNGVLVVTDRRLLFLETPISVFLELVYLQKVETPRSERVYVEELSYSDLAIAGYDTGTLGALGGSLTLSRGRWRHSFTSLMPLREIEPLVKFLSSRVPPAPVQVSEAASIGGTSIGDRFLASFCRGAWYTLLFGIFTWLGKSCS